MGKDMPRRAQSGNLTAYMHLQYATVVMIFRPETLRSLLYARHGLLMSVLLGTQVPGIKSLGFLRLNLFVYRLPEEHWKSFNIV